MVTHYMELKQGHVWPLVGGVIRNLIVHISVSKSTMLLWLHRVDGVKTRICLVVGNGVIRIFQ